MFEEGDLPLDDLAEIGLFRDGRVLLEEADLKALLSGRRTQMLELEDLEFAGMKIASLKAKLSLVTGADGKTDLLLHPEYLRSIPPRYLTDTEAEELENGEVSSFEKTIVDHEGQKKNVLVEFDPETRQYVTTDTDKLEAPEAVNDQPLTAEQKAKFRKGKEVELPDGTKVQYTVTTREGIRANRIMLIASVVFDGGISFMLYHGLKALFGQQHNAASAELGEGYESALDKMKSQQDEEPAPELKLGGNKENNRGYGRTSSR
jgi:hypothetical protein